jgi:hypothetical protein
MALVSVATPGKDRLEPHHLEEEVKTFLEAFSLLETGMMPAEILKRIA